MSRNQVAKLLQDLGFCPESATLYVCLLTEGPLAVEDLIHKTGLDAEQVFPLLGAMIANRLIFEDGGRYWVLNPGKAFKAFANDVLWSVTSTLSDSLEDVPKDRLDYVRMMRGICQQLQTAASKLYSYRSPIAVGRIKIAREPDQLAVLLTEAIDTANEEILCVSTSPRQHQLSVIWGSLLARIKSGIKYVRIVDITEIVEHGFTIVQRDISEVGVELYVIERNLIDCKFYVIDDKFVVMFTPDKYNAYDFTLTGQVISNKLITGKYRKTFDALLEKSIPASFVLELMAEQKNNLLTKAAQKMSLTTIRWLECLIDFGIYCKFPEFDAHQLASAIDCTIEANLVEMRNTGKMEIPLPKYSWSVTEIRSLWLTRRQTQSTNHK